MSIAAAAAAPLLRRSRGAVGLYYDGFRRSFATQTPEIPKLLLSSPDNPESRYLYDLTGDDRKPIAFNREIHLPQIAGHRLIGSSEGYLFSVDPIGEIHASDPFTGARLQVPSTAALPNMVGAVRDPDTGNLTHYVSNPYLLVDPDPPGIQSVIFSDCYASVLASTVFDHRKFQVFSLDCMRRSYFGGAILSPSLDTVVVIHRGLSDSGQQHLAFSRIGGSSWTAIRSPEHCYEDVIFHKGRLHAVNTGGTLSVFDGLDHPSGSGPGPPLRSRNGPLSGEDCSLRRWVVESPDGEELLLVFRDLHDDSPPRTQVFKVYKLDKTSQQWKRVGNIGDLALFLGLNHSISLSASDYPAGMIKPNCIYFTDVYNAWYVDRPRWPDDTGVYSLKDGIIRFYELRDGSRHLHWPPPVWFVLPPTRC